jgi:hypothetical protein
MIRSRKNLEFVAVAFFVLCAFYIFEIYFDGFMENSARERIVEKSGRYEATELEEKQTMSEQEAAHEDKKEQTELTLIALQSTSTLTHSAVVATSSAPPLDRVVVMAKLPKDDTSWVHTDLQDWQSAIYSIDIETSHNQSTLDPLSNSTIRTLRKKGNEANAYLVYILQHYHNLPSTIAFLHPHKDGWPVAWHTDAEDHSNVISLQTLNINFVQRNGYVNLRCLGDPGCPQEVMPFRDPPEEHRTTELAMADAWRNSFNNSDVPQILATPCCAQFAVSSRQVRERSLDEYKAYYKWLIDTPLNDYISGRIFEYLWHVLFRQDPV